MNFGRIQMSKKYGKNDMEDSQSAIKDNEIYMGENTNRHRARVLISSKGKKLYNNLLFISVDTDPSNTYVIVEGDNEYIRDFYDKYRCEGGKFSFVNGTLIIQATDIWGKAIELNITRE